MGPTCTWVGRPRCRKKRGKIISVGANLLHKVNKPLICSWFYQYHQDKKWKALNAKLIFWSKIIKEKQKENTKTPHLALNFGQPTKEREKENLKSKKPFSPFLLSKSRPTHIYPQPNIKNTPRRIKSKKRARIKEK